MRERRSILLMVAICLIVMQCGDPAPVRAQTPFATSTILASARNPALVGAPVTFTATVIGESPTGTVAFMDGAEPLGTVALVGSRATLTLASLAEGRHTLTAVYGGDAGNTASTSLALLQSVSRISGAIAVAGSGYASFALRGDGSVTGWSDNALGELSFPESVRSGVVAIAAGEGHVVALKDDGSVVAWGWNASGQTVVPPAAASGVRAIAAGWRHTLALKEDGSVVAWGWNGDGQCEVPGSAASGVIAIAAGLHHSVALKDDGSIVIWGDYAPWVVPAAAASGVVSVAAGIYRTVALKNDGSVVAWDRVGSTIVPAGMTAGVVAIADRDYGLTALKQDGSVISDAGVGSGFPIVPLPPSASSGVVAIAAGRMHALALKEDGSVLAWGRNQEGQLDVPNFEVSVAPSGAVSPGETIAFTGSPSGLDCTWDGSAFSGTCNSASLLKGTKVVVTAHPSPGTFVGSWGRGCDAVTPTTCTIDRLVADLVLAPVAATGAPAVPGAPAIGRATPDDTRALVSFTPQAADEGRVLWYTVTSSEGQTGTGPASPVLVSGLSNLASYTFAVTATNAAGTGPASAASNSVVPMPRSTILASSANPVPPGRPLTLTATVLGNNPTGTVTFRDGDATLATVELAGGKATYTTATLEAGRHVLTASYGGDAGNTASSSIPLRQSVNPHAGVIAIAAGGWHSAALTRDGSVVAWGNNDWGQTAVPAEASSGVVAIAAGWLHTAALKSDGSVVVWGSPSQPVPAVATSGVVAIAAGMLNTVALKADGSVVVWGDNYYGQSNPPAAAAAGVVAVTGGNYHTVALKSDGSSIGWGVNTFGQITPPSSAGAGLVAVSAGGNQTVVLKSDGSVEAWGQDRYDLRAVPPAAGAEVVAISAGGQHITALKSDGSMIAWGRNGNGESTIPAAAASGVAAISAAGNITLALKEDGTVVAWGWNEFGQTTVPYHHVSVALSGSLRPGDDVKITAAADGIDCSWDGTSTSGSCLSLARIKTTRVVLRATLPAHTVIDSWGMGCDATTADSCTIDRLEADVTISPVVRVEPALMVTVVPQEGGVVTAEGIDCPGTCTGDFPDVTATAHLTATPADGYTFLRWEEDATGSAPTQELPMTTDRRVTALFATTRSVCADGCEHGGIQEALDAAGTGDTIAVAPGIWRGNFVLGTAKELTLRGTGASPAETVLSGDTDPGTAGGDGTVLSLDAADGVAARIRIENLTLTGGAAPCGGGLRAEASGSGELNLTLARVKIRGNAALAGGAGGGICARSTGGGSLDLSLENVMVTGNQAQSGGGISALADGAGSTLRLVMTSSTVGGNTATTGGGVRLLSQEAGTLSAEVVNCIFSGGIAAIGPDLHLEQTGGATATVEARYSDIQASSVVSGMLVGGVGMQAASAVFRNPAKGNFRLNADSPCIDAGTDQGAPPLDHEGKARPQGPGYDMGALEFTPSPPAALKLLALTGREIVPGGQPYDITWAAPVSLTRFKVYFSNDGGGSWSLLATVRGAGRHHAWIPPRKNLATCRVKIDAYNRRGDLVSSVKSARNFTVRR